MDDFDGYIRPHKHFFIEGAPVPDPASEDDIDAAGSFVAYADYNKVLRTWFVAFGIAGPALFLTNKTVADRLAEVHSLRLVAMLFLVGVGLQVGGAFINKVANFYVHAKYNQLNVTVTPVHAIAEWVAGQFWIDIAFDVATIGGFGYAAWLMLTAFAT